jgi:hypothetical protein
MTTKQDIVIVFALDSDGETTHVATWGRGIEDCSRAADWGNKMKDKLGWPETLHAQPRVYGNYKLGLRSWKRSWRPQQHERDQIPGVE